MNLLQVSRMSSTRDSKQSIGKFFSIIHWQTRLYMEEKLRPYGLGGGKLHILIMLYHKDGLSQQEISRSLRIDKATVSREIRKLEKQGYVIRKKDLKDKRIYRVHLTEKARKIKSTVKKEARRWQRILLKDFTEKEKKSIMQMLEKIAQNAILAHRKGNYNGCKDN